MTILSVKLADGTWVDIPAIIGPPGSSGVHIGSDNPPENANVWINPNGDPTGTEDWEFDLDDGSTDTKQVVVLNSDESSGKLAVLRFKQPDGTWMDIPAIKGDPGKDGKDGKTPVKGEDYNDGAKGEPGDSGVYIGTSTPPANANVWVNPSGDPTSTENWEFDLDDGSTEEKQVVVVNSDEATANGVLGILKVKQADGTWKEIPALVGDKGPKGDPGKDATIEMTEMMVEEAVDGTYKVIGTKITFSGGTVITVMNGEKGDPGTTDFNRLTNKPTTENWTFTLEDGSKVTKAVYIG